MVLPRVLVHAARTLKSLIDNGSPWLEQATMAKFIKNGSLATQLKRVRQTYRRRRDVVLAALGATFGEVVVTGSEGGTHLLWRVPEAVGPAAQLRCNARRIGVGLHPLEHGAVLFPEALPDSDLQVVLGYTHLNEAQIRDGISKIGKAAQQSQY